jgi:hypothetical protein
LSRPPLPPFNAETAAQKARLAEDAWNTRLIVELATLLAEIIKKLDALAKPDVLEALRLVPGAQVVQAGQRGAVTSLFVRGGASNFNKVLIDSVAANDLGGGFDFSSVAVTGVDSVGRLSQSARNVVADTSELNDFRHQCANRCTHTPGSTSSGSHQQSGEERCSRVPITRRAGCTWAGASLTQSPLQQWSKPLPPK